MKKEIGHARNTSPEDEMDARELVPEMMERLWAGEAIELADTVGRPYTRCRLVDYVEQVADRPHLCESVACLIRMHAGESQVEAALILANKFRAAIEEACEADADYYAAAKREISENDKG